MRLTDIEIRNFKQHRHLDLDLDAGVVGIIGRNGSGKSNTLGAIQFALSGSQPGFTKAELTSWGEKTGSVTLGFSHDGSSYKLHRSTNTSAVSLTSYNVDLHGAEAIDNWLKDKIIDTDLLNQVVFVNQAKIDSILFDRPAARSQAFQKMIGLGDANKIYDSIGSFITSLPREVDHSDAIASLDRELVSLKEDLANAEKSLESSVSEFGDNVDDLIEETERSAKKYRRWKSCLSDILPMSNKLAAAEKLYADCMLERPLDPVTVPPKPEDPHNLRKRQSFLMEGVKWLEESKTLVSELSNAYKDLEEARTALPEVNSSREDIESWKLAHARDSDLLISLGAEKRSLEEHRKACEKASKVGSDGVPCPTCGTPISGDFPSDKAARLEEVLKEYSDCQNLVTLASGTISELSSYVDSMTKKMERAEESVRAADSRLSVHHSRVLEGVDIDTDLDTLKSDLESVTDDLDKVDKSYRDWVAINEKSLYVERTNAAIAKRLEDARTASDAASKELDYFLASLDSEVMKAFIDGTDVDALADAEASKLVKLTRVSAERRSLIDRVNRIMSDVASKDAEITKLREAEKEYKSNADRVNVIKSVRSWFHHDNGPSHVVSTILERMTPSVNYFLGRFGSPFAVTSETGTLGFNIHMTDGSKNPETPVGAKALSGAQKNILALSFRLACYHMFSSRLGILVLDEPTAHLDSYNVGKFGELLQRLQTLATEMSFQVIVVTHHLEIMPFFDKVIEIG